MRKLSALIALVLAAVIGVAAPAAAATAVAKVASGAGAPGSSASTKTLVLYDSTGAYGWLGEDYAMMATNLVSHFGVSPDPSHWASRQSPVDGGEVSVQGVPAAVFGCWQTSEAPLH